MKPVQILSIFGIALLMTGCATSSKVQEMIDANHRDYTDRADAHEASIDILKKSAVTGLETARENSETLDQVDVRLQEIGRQLQVIQGYAEASKVMSAANTVKVADLDDQFKAFMESDAELNQRMKKIDELYERVMIAHYQSIAESATAAAESLKEEGWRGSTNAPVKIDKPIEIVAPDTTVITSTQPATATGSATNE